jgi:hypothetical protein
MWCVLWFFLFVESAHPPILGNWQAMPNRMAAASTASLRQSAAASPEHVTFGSKKASHR